MFPHRLVAAFGDRDDVVFLAPSHDTRANLEVFLKSNTFAYQVVPDAIRLNELFAVNAHPRHVIIDRQGRILWRQSGTMTLDVLKPIVERALALSAKGD